MRWNIDLVARKIFFAPIHVCLPINRLQHSHFSIDKKVSKRQAKTMKISTASSWSQLLLFLSALPLGAQGYVTSYSAIPVNKQIEWLKKLTGDICESPTGELPDEMIEAAPEIIKGWRSSKCAGTENAMAVETLVKRLIDESKAGNPKAMPLTTFEYNCVLEGWARSGAGAFAAERCELILTEMEERYHDGDANVQPNLSSFKATLMAWRESEESYSAYRAQRVLEWMIRLHADGVNEQVLPDSDCF